MAHSGPHLGSKEGNIVKLIVSGSKGSQRGQGMVEYALILVLVSIVVIVILLTMGNQIANVFSNVVAALG
jgi:pilus assembly protein Flp/PilA